MPEQKPVTRKFLFWLVLGCAAGAAVLNATILNLLRQPVTMDGSEFAVWSKVQLQDIKQNVDEILKKQK